MQDHDLTVLTGVRIPLVLLIQSIVSVRQRVYTYQNMYIHF